MWVSRENDWFVGSIKFEEKRRKFREELFRSHEFFLYISGVCVCCRGTRRHAGDCPKMSTKRKEKLQRAGNPTKSGAVKKANNTKQCRSKCAQNQEWKSNPKRQVFGRDIPRTSGRISGRTFRPKKLSPHRWERRTIKFFGRTCLARRRGRP